MQIALIHYASPPTVGGVEMVMARQAQSLARAGIPVRILTGRGQQWDQAIPVTVLPRLDSRHPEILKAKAALDQGQIPEYFPSLIQQIKADLLSALDGVEILIVHNVASLHKNLALTAALNELSNENLALHQILWHHDLAWTAPRYQAELHNGYPWDLLRTVWPNVRQVVVSQSRREELSVLMGLPKEEIRVVPAGIDLADFLNLGEQVQCLNRVIHFAQADPILLTPVRLTPRKNLEQAIRILSALREIHPQAALIITGPPGAHNPSNAGYFRSLCELRSQLNLDGAVHLLAETFPDGLSDGSISELYRVADALLITSREEGFGIPILEAGLTGLPIFCTWLDPLRELAGANATFFSPDENPEAVAQAITQFLVKNPQSRLRRQVRTQFTWEAIYQQKIAPLLEYP